MNTPKPPSGKKYFTAREANAMLPLVRAIIRDVTELARDLRERYQRLGRARNHEGGPLSEAHQEELEQAQAEFEQAQARMEEYEEELRRLGVELKDYFTGLIDFPAWMEGREVYLCWRQGEPEVAHWHELDAGFAGRQKLTAGAGSGRPEPEGAARGD
jgi:hypothetical protein